MNMFKILFNNSIMVDGKGPSEITGLIQGRPLYEKNIHIWIQVRRVKRRFKLQNTLK